MATKDQLRWLAAVIRNVKRGDAASMPLLREALSAAVAKVGPYGLATLGECLLHLGKEAIANETLKN